MKLMISVAFTAASLLLSNVALADDAKPDVAPIELTTVQMDKVTAGTGRDNIALQPWSALFAAGFEPTHNSAADGGVIDNAGFMGVVVPRKP